MPAIYSFIVILAPPKSRTKENSQIFHPSWIPSRWVDLREDLFRAHMPWKRMCISWSPKEDTLWSAITSQALDTIIVTEPSMNVLVMYLQIFKHFLVYLSSHHHTLSAIWYIETFQAISAFNYLLSLHYGCLPNLSKIFH